MIDGTAVAPGDYTHRQGVVTFEPGERQALVATTIVNDEAVEGAESFRVLRERRSSDGGHPAAEDRGHDRTTTDG